MMHDDVADIEREIEKLGYGQMSLEDELEDLVKRLNNAADEYEKTELLKKIDFIESELEDIKAEREKHYQKLL